MNGRSVLEFALVAEIRGKAVSAKSGLPFSKFAEFNEEVQKYVLGSDSPMVLRDLEVQIDEGSYLLRVVIPAGILLSVMSDTRALQKAGGIGEMDANRAKVILRWQERAKADPSYRYSVRSREAEFEPVEITHESDFSVVQREQWVPVERYLIGEIVNWGGAANVNLHVRPKDQRELIIVDATEEQIRDQRQNLVYHRAIVHVRARQNLSTGKLEGFRLIDLREYSPKVDERRLQSLFEKGVKAWIGVKKAGAWVEELRGGSGG